MVNVIASSEICSWFEPQSGKAKDQPHSYMLLLRKERKIKVNEETLVGSE